MTVSESEREREGERVHVSESERAESTKCFTCHEVVLCLPRNLHFELCKALRLPQNLHFEVHKVLHLPRNLHFEVKPLRKVDFKDHESTRFPFAPATKSGHHVRKRARHHNESAVATSTRRPPADSASLRSRNALRGFREA